VNRPSHAGDVREGGRWGRAQRWKNDAIYVGVRIALWVADRTPRTLLVSLASLVGFTAWMVRGCPRGRRRAFMDAGESLALCVLLRRNEVRALEWLDCDRDAISELDAALAPGRGAVVVSAHLGPFELVPAAVAELGHRPAVVVRESYDPRLDALVDAHRTGRGVNVIHRGRHGAGVRALRALRRGQPLGLLPDLPTRVERVSVTLLGRPAELAVGPARLARLAGVPLLVATAARPPGSRRHRLRVRRISLLDTDDDARLTQRIADELSQAIHEAPHQWLGSLAPLLKTPHTL
jgi:lauroyl/myristoyl acyltransferase